MDHNRVKLGDVVHEVAQPIAKTIDFVFGTNLENCSGCQHRQQILNDFSDSIYDVFWNRQSKKRE